jgi:signal transduction histidine kinase
MNDTTEDNIQSLEKQIEVEQDIIKIKDDFISMAAHELKTPLTSLRAYNQIIQSLLKRHDAESALAYTHKMQVQFDKLNKLIFDLLDVSRIQSGHLDFSQSIFYLDDLVKEVISALQPAFQTHLIFIQGKTRARVVADLDRISQVVTNFVVNAIKYSPQSDHVVVTLDTTSSTNNLHVQDFGIGIDKRHQTKIFERFYRVSNDRDTKYAGLGIGLYVCSQIITKQGGRIWVDSYPGNGSTFSFSLPCYDRLYESQNFSR